MENRGREPRVEGEEGRPVRDTTIIPVRGCVLDEDGDRGCGKRGLTSDLFLEVESTRFRHGIHERKVYAK